jgi:hypothetical protein
MSPQDDVNRFQTLATGIVILQPNFAVDSRVGHPNPVGPEIVLQHSRRNGRKAKRRTFRRALRSLPGCGFQAVAVASAFTRAERRDILRATVFLWATPLVTPRAISG